jgi:hypothetical protein
VQGETQSRRIPGDLFTQFRDTTPDLAIGGKVAQVEGLDTWIADETAQAGRLDALRSRAWQNPEMFSPASRIPRNWSGSDGESPQAITAESFGMTGFGWRLICDQPNGASRMTNEIA